MDPHHQQVTAGARRSLWQRLIAHRGWDGVPDVVRGLLHLLASPLRTLRRLGREQRLRTVNDEVIVTPTAIVVHDGAETERYEHPVHFSSEAFYGGGARVIAALEDGRDVALPLGDLTVAEAEETAESLRARLREQEVRDGRYR